MGELFDDENKPPGAKPAGPTKKDYHWNTLEALQGYEVRSKSKGKRVKVTPKEPPQPEQSSGWQPANWLEMQYEGPVVAYSELEEGLGLASRSFKDKVVRRILSRRDIAEAGESGRQNHRLLVQTVQFLEEQIPLKIIDGRLKRDQRLQDFLGATHQHSYLDGNQGLELDTQNEIGRITSAALLYHRQFPHRKSVGEITLAAPLCRIGELSVYFIRRIDLANSAGTVDAKFGQELSDEQTAYTLAADALGFEIYKRGLPYASDRHRLYLYRESGYQLLRGLGQHGQHLILYPDRLVTPAEYGITPVKIQQDGKMLLDRALGIVEQKQQQGWLPPGEIVTDF